MIYIPYDDNYPILWDTPRNGKQFTALELGCFFNGKSSVVATELSTYRIFLMENADTPFNALDYNRRASILLDIELHGDIMLVGINEMDEDCYNCYYDEDKEVE